MAIYLLTDSFSCLASRLISSDAITQFRLSIHPGTFFQVEPYLIGSVYKAYDLWASAMKKYKKNIIQITTVVLLRAAPGRKGRASQWTRPVLKA